MSMFGSELVAHSAELLAVDSRARREDVGFRHGAYLFLAGADQALETLQRGGPPPRRDFGADVVLLDARQLRERFAWLRTDAVVGGSARPVG